MVTGGENIKRILRQARVGQGVREVRVGFFADAKYPDGTPVAAVALWNEFGTRKPDGSTHIPERPFFRQAVKKAEKEVPQLIARHIGADLVVDRQLAGLSGEATKSLVQESIKYGSFEANAPSTRERKKKKGRGAGSPKPLIDTGTMRASVSWELRG